MDIGTRIKDARVSNGISKSELAKLIGVSPQAVGQMESGATKNPKPQHIFAIADVTGFEPRWIATGEGHKTRKDAALDSIDISDLSVESKTAIRAVASSFSQQANAKETLDRNLRYLMDDKMYSEVELAYLKKALAKH